MTQTTYGWLVIAFPLAGTLTIGFGYRVLPEFNIPESTVPGDPDGVEVLDWVLVKGVREQRAMFVDAVRRDDHLDLAADRYCGRVSIEPLRCRIPGRDCAVDR